MNTFDSGQYSKTSFNDSRETNSEMSVATSEDAAPETIVEIAQTAAALRVGPLGAGQAQTVPVNPGQQIVITGLNAGATQQAFRQDGGSLVITFPDSSIVTLQNYFVIADTGLPPALTLADGTVIGADQVVSSIAGFDPAAIAPAAGGPAAGGGAGGGGANFSPYAAELIGDGIDAGDLLGQTNLQFGLIEGAAALAFVAPEAPAVDEDLTCLDRFQACVNNYLAAWTHEPDEWGEIYYGDADTSDNSHIALVGDDYINTDYSVDDGFDVENVFYNDGVSFGEGNDVLDANNVSGSEPDIMVGDALVIGYGSSNTSEMHYSLIADANVEGASNTTFTAFSDHLIGAPDTRTMVGDLFMLFEDAGSDSNGANLTADNEIYTWVGYGSNADGHADNNTFTAFNDILDGRANDGDSTLVGDLFWLNESSVDEAEIHLVADNNIYDNLDGEGGSASANNNQFSAFNDLLQGGVGNDTLVGDVLLQAPDADDYDEETGLIEFDVSNDVRASGSWQLIPHVETYEDGQYTWVERVFTPGEANNNSFRAFDDVLDGGAGNDLLVGDVMIERQGYVSSFDGIDIELDNYVSPGYGNGYGEGQADNNSFSAFNDCMYGGDEGVEELNNTSFLASFGLGTNYNAENVATNLETWQLWGLMNGPGADVMVGDFMFYANSSNAGDIYIDIQNNVFGNASNTFTAFSDGMVGGAGNDLMVGDALWMPEFYSEGEGYLSLDGEGFADNFEINIHGDGHMTLFSDILCGGEGDDLLVGDFMLFDDDLDFNFGDMGLELDLGEDNLPEYGLSFNLDGLTIEGEGYYDFMDDYNNPESKYDFTLTLFQDTIEGNEGNDVIVGGYGDDTLTGGAGSDIFLYTHIENDGGDTITDFGNGGVASSLEYDTGDLINLDRLFDQLENQYGGNFNGQDERAEMVHMNGNVLTIDTEGEGGGHEDQFSITIEGTAFADFNGGMSYDDLLGMGIYVGGDPDPS